MSVLLSTEDFRKAAACSGVKRAVIEEIFAAPAFFVSFNRHGWFTGFDTRTQQPCFLLELQAARQIAAELEQQHGISLQRAVTALADAAHQHKGEHFVGEQEVSIDSDIVYWEIIKGFKALAKQAKVQVLQQEVCQLLAEATAISSPLDPNPSRRSQQPVHMFLAIDFEWWEKSDDYILEIGWSLWDTLTCKHRSRHWIIKENLNKCNGRFISDNRNRFLFGTSQTGSLEKATDALQDELDKAGLTDGLSYQEKQAVQASGVEVVLVGHALAADMEQAHLHEVEFPPGMTKCDTQKLFMAWQLQRLDAAATAAALQQVVGHTSKTPSAPGRAAPTLEEPGAVGVSEEEDDDYPPGLPPGHDSDDDDDDDVYASGARSSNRSSNDAVAAVTSKLSELKPGSSGSSTTSSSRGAAPSTPAAGSASQVTNKKGRPKGPPQVQNPPRVRPWPAGPAPAGNDCPNGVAPGVAAAAKKQRGEGEGPRVDHQASLQTTLAALGIKASRLHNAGNDARFTMEAFLALTGHEICPDPAEAHLAGTQNDDRYKQQLEASMQAALEQGWGAPVVRGASAGSSKSCGGGSARGGRSGRGAAANGRGAAANGRAPAAAANDRGLAGAATGAWSAGGRGAGSGGPRPGGSQPRPAGGAGVPPGFAAACSNKSPAWARALGDVMNQQQLAAAAPAAGRAQPRAAAPRAAAKPAARPGGEAAAAAGGGRPGRQAASGWDSGGDAGSGFQSAWNSSVGTAAPVTTYQPSADGW